VSQVLEEQLILLAWIHFTDNCICRLYRNSYWITCW